MESTACADALLIVHEGYTDKLFFRVAHGMPEKYTHYFMLGSTFGLTARRVDTVL